MHLRHLALLLAFLSLVPLKSSAAILWQTPHNITGNSDVFTDGDFLQAFALTTNLYSDGDEVASVGGVEFEAIQLNSSYGYLQLSGFQGADDVFGSSSAPFSQLGADYQKLLSFAHFNDANFVTPALITLTNLIPDTTYLIQIWANDSRGGTVREQELSSTSGIESEAMIFREGSAGGLGQSIIGTFTTGTGTTMQDITFTTGSLQVNALQLRAIPEPGALEMLAGVALMAILFGYRRRGIRPLL